MSEGKPSDSKTSVEDNRAKQRYATEEYMRLNPPKGPHRCADYWDDFFELASEKYVFWEPLKRVVACYRSKKG
jgi:hypothetical protein